MMRGKFNPRFQRGGYYKNNYNNYNNNRYNNNNDGGGSYQRRNDYNNKYDRYERPSYRERSRSSSFESRPRSEERFDKIPVDKITPSPERTSANQSGENQKPQKEELKKLDEPWRHDMYDDNNSDRHDKQQQGDGEDDDRNVRVKAD